MLKLTRKIATVFGTRPEVIKLAPLICELESVEGLQTYNITSAQHTDLLYPVTSLFRIRIDQDLDIMRPDQTPNQVCSRVLSALDGILMSENPSMMIVQGDTSTALAGALAAFHRQVPVAHVEAGLRSGNLYHPYPEEMNRRLISKLASYHFAPTKANRDLLLAEGVAENNVFVTGNPVIDSLKSILKLAHVSPAVNTLLEKTAGQRRLILTTHRRESFGAPMADNLAVIRTFVEKHPDVALVFPVHLNPVVNATARAILSGHPRIHLIQPLLYDDFIKLLQHAWLIVSDSGGLQEEAPTLGKPLLVLRETTERQEAIDCGVARLVGGRPEQFAEMLEEAYRDGSWVAGVKEVLNPYGSGDSGKRIADAICKVLGVPAHSLKVA